VHHENAKKILAGQWKCILKKQVSIENEACKVIWIYDNFQFSKRLIGYAKIDRIRRIPFEEAWSHARCTDRVLYHVFKNEFEDCSKIFFIEIAQFKRVPKITEKTMLDRGVINTGIRNQKILSTEGSLALRNLVFMRRYYAA
jgi:predicted transcriptional regulator